jgi:hypothetical protein
MLDTNENVNEGGSKLHQLMEKHDMVDIHAHIHGAEDEPATVHIFEDENALITCLDRQEL